MSRPGGVAHLTPMSDISDDCSQEPQTHEGAADSSVTGVTRPSTALSTGSEADVLQHLGHQGGDRRALRPRQCHVREQGMALQLLDHGNDAVVATHPQVVALGDVVGQDDPAVTTDPREHGQQHIALQRLGLVDDDERVVQRAAADID